MHTITWSLYCGSYSAFVRNEGASGKLMNVYPRMKGTAREWLLLSSWRRLPLLDEMTSLYGRHSAFSGNLLTGICLLLPGASEITPRSPFFIARRAKRTDSRRAGRVYIVVQN
jgi:hypothetical protein